MLDIDIKNTQHYNTTFSRSICHSPFLLSFTMNQVMSIMLLTIMITSFIDPLVANCSCSGGRFFFNYGSNNYYGACRPPIVVNRTANLNDYFLAAYNGDDYGTDCSSRCTLTGSGTYNGFGGTASGAYISCAGCCACCCGSEFGNGTFAGEGPCPLSTTTIVDNGDCKFNETSCLRIVF